MNESDACDFKRTGSAVRTFLAACHPVAARSKFLSRVPAGLFRFLAVVLVLGTSTVSHAVPLLVDFTIGGASLQPGFIAQGNADAVYNLGGATVTVDLPLPHAISIVERGFSSLFSSGSSFVADGTDIGFLARDHFLGDIPPGGPIVITLSGLQAVTHNFDGWWSDISQSPNLVFQMLDYSTDGGGTFSIVNNLIDPSGLNASPVSFSFTPTVGQDVVIRVTENNPFNQLRLNAFAVDVVGVPEPATLALIGLGLAGIGFRRRKST